MNEKLIDGIKIYHIDLANPNEDKSSLLGRPYAAAQQKQNIPPLDYQSAHTLQH